MKCFALGVLGAVAGLLIALVLYSQYSDYRAAAQSSGWIQEAEPAQRAVEENALRSGTLSGAGAGVGNPRFTGQGPERFEVSSDGLILMHGGLAGQLVALVPSLGPEGIRWRCFGGSRGDVISCKSDPVALPASQPFGAPAAASTAPTVPASSCLITADAIGPLRLGASLEDVLKRTPGARFTRTSDGEGVALVEAVVDGETLVVAYTGEDDPEQPVDAQRAPEFLETFNPACATAEGIRPGSTVEAAEAVYGPTLRIRRSEIESREYIEFAHAPVGLQFRLDASGEFAEGQNESLRHAPGAKLFSIAVSKP